MWIATTAALTLFLCQDPQPTDPPPSNLDIVVLVGGEKLEGRLVTDSDTYVEIELEQGARVGFSRAQVSAVKRGAGRLTEAAARRGRFQARDDWFLLHDGDGEPVGWLHSTVSFESGGGLRLLEEWEFVTDTKKIAVTMLEITDGDRRPLSCYYRERSGVDGRPHVLDERIVEARIEGESLVVKRMTTAGTERKSYGRPAGLQFPLVASEHLRLGLLDGGAEVLMSVYDPSTEELTTRSFQPGRPRHVQLDGEDKQIVEVSAQTAAGRNSEWLDHSYHVLRREINGPALVARPTTEEVAQGHGLAGAPSYPPSLLVERDKRFGLWLPNPTWTFDEEQRPGQITARSDLHEAWVNLVLLDHLDEGTSLETAAEAVERWHALLNPRYRTLEQSDVQVRGRRAVRFEGEARQGRTRALSVVHVIEHDGAFLALTWQAPEQHYDDLTQDFEQLLRRLEPDPEGIEPSLTGPLK